MSRQATELPETMQVVAETIAEYLQENAGVSQAQAINAGIGCAEVMMHTFGGECVYIPKNVFATYTKRDLEVAAMIQYATMREVCEKFGITSRRVYQILQAIKNGEERPEQLSLFDPADYGG